MVESATYDSEEVTSLLVQYGTNHLAAASLRPSRRRHVTLNAITNDRSVAALRMRRPPASSL